MPDLPTGTVTFVFSDLEGSTRLLKQLGDEQFAQLLATHRKLVREVFAKHGGNEIDTQGDAFFYSFSRARAAVAAAVEVQRAHAEQAWPGGVTVNVRLGLHTGEPVVGDEGYTGLDVVRAARIAADGKGGQILLSEATRAIVGGNLPEGVGIRELGERTLKDIDQPEPLFELVYAPEPAPAPEPATKGVSGTNGKSDAPVKLDIDAGQMVKGWSDLAKAAADAIRRDEDPGKLIEERVLERLRNTFGAKIIDSKDRAPRIPKPPAPPKIGSKSDKSDKSEKSDKPSKSFAKQMASLNELRESGVLTDEQYSKAVDRLLSEG